MVLLPVLVQFWASFRRCWYCSSCWRFLEACGYMARIAFVMDRIFRKFGLSGKSFIPILIGTGCGIPGIMASRTIENERDRRMTIMTTTFIPCGAKHAVHRNDCRCNLRWFCMDCNRCLLHRYGSNHCFRYHAEEDKDVRRRSGSVRYGTAGIPHADRRTMFCARMWERGWSFIKKAGTIILLSTIFVWFTSYFGWVDGCIPDADVKTRWNSVFWLTSVRQSAGSLHRWAGATGRQPLQLLPVWLQRKTSLQLWVSCTAAETAPFTQHLLLHLHAVAGYVLPGIQPAVCTVLRCNGCNQA